MASDRPAPALAPLPAKAGMRPGPATWHAVAAFLAVAAVLFVVMAALAPRLPEASGLRLAPAFTGPDWLAGWAQWDSGWYHRIAADGYSYAAGQQSTVAFFPAYPLAVRAAGVVMADPYLAGLAVTLLSGVAVAALFAVWARRRLPPEAAWTALLAYLLFPYAFFLYGVVYADALFVAAVLGAFLLLDDDHPVLAGLVGAVATAARPVGVVLVVGLVVRALERRGALGQAPGGTGPGPRRRPAVDWRRLRPADAGVLLSLLGLGAWCAYLWARFDDPFAFASAQGAWDQGAGPATWLKFQFFEDITDLRSPGAWLLYIAHPVLTVAATCLLPRVFRRFGPGYGTYATLLIALSAFSTKNFFGMARYLLAAFPCFAALGEVLHERPGLRRLYIPAGGVGLVALTAIFGTGYYLS
jgi:hypothetical protein